MLIRKIRILAAACTVLLLAACQTPGAEDKAGSTVTTLRLATIDEVNNNGQSYGPQAFVDGLSAVSGGKLKVEVVEEYGSGDASAESDLVEAIASVTSTEVGRLLGPLRKPVSRGWRQSKRR